MTTIGQAARMIKRWEDEAEALQVKTAKLVLYLKRDGHTERAIADRIGKSAPHVHFLSVAARLMTVDPTMSFAKAYSKAKAPKVKPHCAPGTLPGDPQPYNR